MLDIAAQSELHSNFFLFQMSICNEPMRELSNPGASGSIFYLTNDDEFILKTVQHKEAEFLQKLLPGYFMNLNQVHSIAYNIIGVQSSNNKSRLLSSNYYLKDKEIRN